MDVEKKLFFASLCIFGVNFVRYMVMKVISGYVVGI